MMIRKEESKNNNSKNTTTKRRRRRGGSSKSLSSFSYAKLRNKAFIVLGIAGCVVIAINIYVLGGGFLLGRRRHGSNNVSRPMVHGVPQPPLPVLSKDGSFALQHQQQQQQQQQQQPPPHQLRRGHFDKTNATATNPQNNGMNNSSTDDDGKGRVVEIMQEANPNQVINATLRDRLPTWDQVTHLVGEHAIIYNAKTACPAFRAAVPAVQRMLGAAGMFSTGTNLVTTLLKNNCQIPERVTLYGPNSTREQHGIRWQVPWGKHTPAHYKEAHVAKIAKNVNKEDILPVVTIRNPYTWMESICRNPYSAKWDHNRNDKCPNIVADTHTRGNQNHWNPVSVKYGAGTEHYQSIAHLFNDWYHDYTKNASYPWVMIRMEDLVFHTKETVTAVCECAGGRIRNDRPFTYTVDSAKADSPGHDTTVGFYEAWIRYSKEPELFGGFSEEDYEASKSVLDDELLQMFGYKHPPAS